MNGEDRRGLMYLCNVIDDRAISGSTPKKGCAALTNQGG